MLPTNCWREASRRHLLGLGKRLGGQSQQSDFHMLKLLFVQARPNCLGLAWRGGKPWQPKPWLFVRAAKSPSRCGAGQSLWTARAASALRSCLGQQRTRFRSRDGLPCASRDTRPSHLIQAPAAFFPGQDAGSQRVLSSQPEQKAQRGAGSTESHRAHGLRSARGRALCRAPVAGSGRWGLGWSRAGAAQGVEEHL